jgi:heterodisulfide reductase subunit C
MTAQEREFNYETAKPLVQEVMDRSNQNILACYQCRRCAAGCPVGEETGYVTPDRLIRMIVLGERDTALSNQLVWKCVSCYTCGTRCPNDIQTARITETIKKMSKEHHFAPLAPKVDHFHRTFVNAGVRWGRVNEIEFINFYEIKNALKDLRQLKFKSIYNEMVTQTKLGLNMVRKKRLHFGFQSAKGRDEIKRLFKKTKGKTVTKKEH